MNRLLFLRERCDKYQGRRGSPYRSWVTEFDADKRENVRDRAKLALNTYNQKEQKNFNLEKVCKLNRIGPLFCMTFMAKNAETDECRLFRGVVHGFTHTVFLCEIKMSQMCSHTENHVVLSKIWYPSYQLKRSLSHQH